MQGQKRRKPSTTKQTKALPTVMTVLAMEALDPTNLSLVSVSRNTTSCSAIKLPSLTAASTIAVSACSQNIHDGSPVRHLLPATQAQHCSRRLLALEPTSPPLPWPGIGTRIEYPVETALGNIRLTAAAACTHNVSLDSVKTKTNAALHLTASALGFCSRASSNLSNAIEILDLNQHRCTPTTATYSNSDCRQGLEYVTRPLSTNVIWRMPQPNKVLATAQLRKRQQVFSQLCCSARSACKRQSTDAQHVPKCPSPNKKAFCASLQNIFRHLTIGVASQRPELCKHASYQFFGVQFGKHSPAHELEVQVHCS